MRLRGLTLALIATLTAAGCALAPPRVKVARPLPPPVVPVAVAPPIAPPIAYAPVAPEIVYRLDAGDRLRIVVFGQEGLTNSYAVDANGFVTLPLVGSIRARGLTPGGLSNAITSRLRGGFIRDPYVAVEVETYRPFFILGEVTAPGQYAYVANMTAETAVAIAGGFTPRADKKHIKVTRNLDGALVRGIVPPIYPIMPGDTINIGERWF